MYPGARVESAACLDVVEIDIRAVVQISNEFAINLRVRLLAGLGEGRGLLSCEVHVGDVGLSGAIIGPGYDIAVDRRKRLISRASGDCRLFATCYIVHVDVKVPRALVHPDYSVPIDLGLDLLTLV